MVRPRWTYRDCAGPHPLSAATGYGYGKVHGLLVVAGASLRERGGRGGDTQ
ncbi:MAG: helix-turn-helix domain-containing protein [Natronosporangium sp.]